MEKYFRFFSWLMPVWIILLGTAGFFYPEPFLCLKPCLDLMFFFTMTGIGAVLNVSDFKPILTNPHVVFMGIFAQFLIMPALGFLIGYILNLSVPLKLGLILAGSVPGAMASNVISYLARTDVAYSISITTVATLISPLITPMLIMLYAHTIIAILFMAMLGTLIKIVILPLLIGFLIRHYFEMQIEKFSYVFPAFSTIFIAFICAMVVALNRDYIYELSVLVFVAVVLHNLLGLGFGYTVALCFRFTTKRARTLALEVGMQNAGLGALLALKHFSAQTALVPAVFATWCVITGSLLAERWSKSHSG